jgi:AcrR family transcriptional regulator
MTADLKSRNSARNRLLEAAASLFYSHGIVATGIDAIVERAGVAKKASITISPQRRIW